MKKYIYKWFSLITLTVSREGSRISSGEGGTLILCSIPLQGFVAFLLLKGSDRKDPVHTTWRRDLISVNWPPSVIFFPLFTKKKKKRYFLSKDD